MRRIIITISFCTAILALPAKIPESVRTTKFIRDANHEGKFPVHNQHQIRSTIQLKHLSTLHTRDFFSDLIRATLGMSVKELLIKMEATFRQLGQVTNEGLDKLKEVYLIASPEIQQELAAIKENAIIKVIELIDELLRDLGSVLPALTFKYSTNDSASDSKTLEELVTAMANALCRSLQLLNNTMASFNTLALKAKPEVGAALNKISDESLNRGRSIIIPMLDQLKQLIEPNCVPAKRLKFSSESHQSDFLDGIISTMLGVNIIEAGLEADNVLSQLITIIETTRSNLSDAFTCNNRGNESNAVELEVIGIYDKAMDDVFRDMKPILTVLLHFKESSRREKTFVYDLVVNLMGIRLDQFKSYIHNATSHMERTVRIASTKVVTASAKAGLSSVVKVISILNENIKLAKTTAKPLTKILKSIVDHNKESMVDSNSLKVMADDEWSESEGNSYNRDAIIDAASKLLGFDVSNATMTLKSSLENLDKITGSGLEELQSILSNTNPNLSMDILEIMNETLSTIHITLQPMLDVLLPFLPDPVRPNKQVALDIYVASNGVNLNQFLHYCSLVSKKIPEITDLATIRIQIRASRAEPRVHGQIQSLLRTTDSNTRAIIQPFLDILGPVISPH